MSYTLLDVQRGEAVQLLRCIDNCDGRQYVGLRSITFTVGWYNIEQGETFSWRIVGGAEESINIPPGLYWFDRLKKVLNVASPAHTLEVGKVNGLITLTVDPGTEILLSDGLLKLLGLDDGLGGVWLDAGEYTGDRPVNFMTMQDLWVHLEEISTVENTVNGAPSTLLSVIEVGKYLYGDIRTIRYECPEYKRLQCGHITEFKITIRDKTGKEISNHDLPIDVTLEVIEK